MDALKKLHWSQLFAIALELQDKVFLRSHQKKMLKKLKTFFSRAYFVGYSPKSIFFIYHTEFLRWNQFVKIMISKFYLKQGRIKTETKTYLFISSTWLIIYSRRKSETSEVDWQYTIWRKFWTKQLIFCNFLSKIIL